MSGGRVIFVLWLAAGLAPGAAAGEPPGLYRVDLATGGDPLIVKLVADEPDALVLSFEGSILRVEKKTVRRLERIALPEEPVPEAGGKAAKKSGDRKTGSPSPKKAGSGPRPKAKPTSESTLRDAIETLGSSDDTVSGRAYRLLAREFAAARPQLHRALRHNQHRVRMFAVKLLGEKGAAKDDLEAVAGSLKDDHPVVRRSAVGALRTLGNAGLPALCEYLESESDASNRKAAVQTLKIWHDGRAVVPLVHLLARERDNGVNNFAASALESLTGQNFGKDVTAWRSYLGDKKS